MASTITFTGLASGMDTTAWVKELVKIKKANKYDKLVAKQETVGNQQKAVSTVQSQFSSLRTSLEKITDSTLGGAFDLFAKTKTTSSSSDIVTATSSSGAVKGSYKLSVKQLASATKALSDASALAVTGDTKLSTLSDDVKKLSDGETASFSVYVDGKKSEIELTKEDTIDTVLEKLNNIDGVNASLKDGKVSITGESSAKITLGSNSDTANLTKAFSLLKNSETGSYESFETLSIATSKDKVVDILGSDAKGTFKIGGQEFTIDDDTTFESLIKDINDKSSSSGVKAEFDGTNGQLVFTATTNGSFNINIEKGSSSFTDKMGYTQTNADGSVALKDQELGSFAIFTLDDETRMSSSNTISSDITGIEGVTFNLKGVSNDDNPTTTIGVSQDTDDLVSALKGWIEQYNKTLDMVDEQTASDGALSGESSLENLRRSIRSGASAKQSGAGEYSLLAQIGISTGEASTDLSKLTDHLELDESKLKEALEKDPEGVKALLVGGKNNTGILTNMETTVDNSLKSTGYFTTRNNSLDREKTNLTSSATAENTRIEAYQARLQAQFQAMENMISKMQSAYSSALSQMGLS